MTELERETRLKRIDKQLTTCGWKVVPFRSELPLSSYNACAVEEFPTDNGPVDYALVIDNAIVGLVEAKKLSLGPQNVLIQAQRYSKGLKSTPHQAGEFGVPFLYSTNGEVIWFHDVRDELDRSRTIVTFHTPDGLREKLRRNLEDAVARLHKLPNDHPRLRDYQIQANADTEESIAKRDRQLMLAMATGTGKTFTMVNQIYRLMKCGVAKRVLFLVDRRALAAQAVRAFASMEPEPGLKLNQIYELYTQQLQRDDFEDDASFKWSVLPRDYLVAPNPGHAFVYVCTIQRMALNLFGKEARLDSEDEIPEDAEKENIPIHAFDLIVADECHRGYTKSELSIWRATLDHFDAIKLGLTATPAAHTKAYFSKVVFRYPYAVAVKEGHLVDYDIVSVNSNVRMNGVFLEEGEQIGIVDTESGAEQLDLLEDERTFDTSEIEKAVTVPDSNRKIIEEIKLYASQHESKYGRFPKTLIFASNDIPHRSHSDELVRLCREIFGRGDAFVQKITGSPTVDKPLQRIREFRNRTMPGIVVTVDMLSTGVDIPDLEFIVFLRPVKSRILFEQMLGRGTRKGERHPDKSHFTVFDCFNGTIFEYFRKVSAFTREPPDKPSRSIAEVIDSIWNNQDRDYNARCLARRIRRIDKEMSSEARPLFAKLLGTSDLVQYSDELPELLAVDFVATMNVLRNPDLQTLLVEFPRPKKSFLRAYEAEDAVSSSLLIRDGNGVEYKPSDYLEAFSDYVRNNAEQIEAISILLHRPRSWRSAALVELRERLAQADKRFTTENLQRAHFVTYHKALVDIISMVKHAMKQEQPLLTAEERVDRAIKLFARDRDLNEEQRNWLDLISRHLIENLSIDQNDFDDVPVFSRHGGWAKANKVFSGRLAELLIEINEALVA